MPQKKVFHDSDSEEDVQASLFDVRSKKDVKDGLQIDGSSEEEEQLIVDSDSDSAPEDVGFIESRQTVLERVKDALSAIHREKSAHKTLRRERAKQFSEQKKKKLEKLAASRLPEDFLADLSKTSKKREINEIGEIKKKKKKENPVSRDSDSLEELEQESFQEAELSFGSDGQGEDSEFIPFQRGGVSAVVLKEEIKKTLSSAQKAADFRQQQLYGSRIPRETGKSKLLKKTKKKARFLK